MTIAVTCPHCQARLTLKDEFAGRRGACPKCKGAIQVPAAGEAAPASPRAPAPTPAVDDRQPIRVSCPQCGKVLQGQASMAGKRVKCPACSHVLVLPGGQQEAAAMQPAAAPPQSSWFDQAMDDSALAKPPPSREPLAAAANPYAAPATLEQRVSSRGRASSSDDDLTAFDWVLAILCTNIACIIGIYWLVSGNSKGGKMLTAVGIVYAVSIGLGVILGLISAAVGP